MMFSHARKIGHHYADALAIQRAGQLCQRSAHAVCLFKKRLQDQNDEALICKIVESR
jgi:hypothetical protein